jgi:hypothetical protein
VKKLLFLAIGLFVLGAAAIGIGVYKFSDASHHEAYAADDRAKGAAAKAKEATRTQLERSIPGPLLSESYLQGADITDRYVEELRIVGWISVGGGVVLAGSGILVLLAHRRRVTRATGDATATQVIRRI